MAVRRKLSRSRRYAPINAAVLIAFAALVPLELSAQDPIPASLLKRMASLASGYQTGGPAFLVGCFGPTEVLQIFETETEARAFMGSVTGPCALLPVTTQSPDTTRAMTATLGRVVAEAADGHRTGEPVWVAAGYEFDHPVLGVFPTYDEALAAISDSLETYGVFGPFETPPDIERGPMLLVAIGCHVPGSKRICPWLPIGPLQLDAVDRMELGIFTTAGDTTRYQFSPTDIDALFFTISAFDKFFAPYYTHVYGPEFTSAMREELMRYGRGDIR